MGAVRILIVSTLLASHVLPLAAKNTAGVPAEVLESWHERLAERPSSSAIVTVEVKRPNSQNSKSGDTTYWREFIDGSNYKIEEFASLQDAIDRKNFASVKMRNDQGLIEIGANENGQLFIRRFIPVEQLEGEGDTPIHARVSDLVLDLPWIAWAVPLGAIENSQQYDFVGWGPAEDDENGWSCKIDDLSEEPSKFSKVSLTVDPEHGYRISHLEADFVGKPERYRKVRTLKYDESGLLVSSLTEFVEQTERARKVNWSSSAMLSDFASSVPAEEFTPEFYGLVTPFQKRHWLNSMMIAAVSFALFLAVIVYATLDRRRAAR